jgi:hypothetical protein
MSSPTPFRTALWVLMRGYLVASLVLFARGMASAQRVRPGPAWGLAAIGFVVDQGVFVIFNR